MAFSGDGCSTRGELSGEHQTFNRLSIGSQVHEAFMMLPEAFRGPPASSRIP